MIAGVDEHRVGTVSADIVRSLDAGLPQVMINPPFWSTLVLEPRRNLTDHATRSRNQEPVADQPDSGQRWTADQATPSQRVGGSIPSRRPITAGHSVVVVTC